MTQMEYKEYFFDEDEGSNDLTKFFSPFVDDSSYSLIHQSVPITCHDAMIEYCGGFLLVKRDNSPARNQLYPIGGRVLRGIPIEKSLKERVKKECNLSLSDLRFVDVSRHYYNTDPFGHGKGTDTFSVMFYAKGHGELKLDNFHKSPLIVTKQMYTLEFKSSLNPWVRDFMDKAMLLLDNHSVKDAN